MRDKKSWRAWLAHVLGIQSHVDEQALRMQFRAGKLAGKQEALEALPWRERHNTEPPVTGALPVTMPVRLLGETSLLHTIGSRTLPPERKTGDVARMAVRHAALRKHLQAAQGNDR